MPAHLEVPAIGEVRDRYLRALPAADVPAARDEVHAVGGRMVADFLEPDGWDAELRAPDPVSFAADAARTLHERFA
jgi:hypothetical protein